MNRTRPFIVLLLLASLGAAQSTAGGAAEIEQLQVRREGADVTIQVILTGSVKPAVETAINPDRLVLVLPGTLSDAKQKHFPLEANGVKAVRLGLNSANPPVTRVVVDLDSVHPYTLNTEGNVITLRVQATEAVTAARRNGPVPAASAPLMGVFRRKPQAPATDSDATASTPIPVPPKFPPINFPDQQSPSKTQTTVASTPAPSTTHPKLGSLQQGTVFPGMGTPGAGSVPVAQSTATPVTTSAPNPNPEFAVKTVPTSNAPASKDAPSSMSVSVTPATQPASSATTTAPAIAEKQPTAAQPPASNQTAQASTVSTNVAPAPAKASATTANPSSAGSPNITAQVLSATVATPPPAPAATVSNSPGQTASASGTDNAGKSAAPASQGAAAAAPTSTAPVVQGATASNAASTAAPTSATTAAAQGATVANPSATSQASSTATAAPAPSVSQGATVSNPLGLAPGETAQIAVIEPEVSEPEPTIQKGPEVPLIEENGSIEENVKSTVVAKATEPDIATALALRAAHPDFRTAFHVKYVAAGTAYLDGGRSAGLSKGMKLVVRDTPTGATAAAANGNPDHIVAELEVTSVAESSAVTDVHTPNRDVKPGDLAYLSSQDTQSLVTQSTLSATRKYPTVISFTEGDTLDEEARVQVPRPPMPSVNRARGRIGIDYMGTSFHGSTGGMNTDLGLVARLDMTRIGGTYWNASGYWRGRLTANNYTGNSTLQDLINRTYHLSMNYDNPNSPWVAGFGRMYLPWATSLDTLDGGYFGRRVGHTATLGAFAGSTPDPTSWSYSPDRRIGGVFVNFEGGSYDSFRYSSTSGMALSTLKWKIDRPFVFFENGIYYKRYVAIYDSLQADSPVGYTAGGSPGAGIARNFLTVRFQPHERVEFDANYSYLRDIPTFDPTLVGTTLLDKYLFQGFSGGVRLEPIKGIWVYTNLGKSNRSGDTSSSLNELYGLTFDRLPWVHIRADGHYARFNSSFGNGTYQSVSLSRSIGDSFRLELLGGQQNFVSPLSSNTNSKFVTSNVEMNMGAHYFIQGGFTVSRGLTQSYDQWLFSMGYRFDSRRAKAQ
jgi:hypothetical protein